MLRGFIAIGLALVFVPQSGRAQPRSERLEFEAATVKQKRDGVGGALVRTPGRLAATNVTFTSLLEMAFETRQIDFSRVPESIRFQNFDISAKASVRISGDQYWQMLRSLLEDRFQLKYHRENRDAPFYALIPAKKGTLGPKLSSSADAECPVSPNTSNFCGVQAGLGSMFGQRVSMARIAREFASAVGRPVANQTGLDGVFDFQLRWTPEDLFTGDGDKKLNGAPLDTSAPSFFRAIQEQLGLKLESKKGPVEFLVIDHAEEPREN